LLCSKKEHDIASSYWRRAKNTHLEEYKDEIKGKDV
jgi:hypothetical protein